MNGIWEGFKATNNARLSGWLGKRPRAEETTDLPEKYRPAWEQ